MITNIGISFEGAVRGADPLPVVIGPIGRVGSEYHKGPTDLSDPSDSTTLPDAGYMGSEKMANFASESTTIT